MNIYVVYLTSYKGNKLPPFYVGSSSEEKVLNGYKGSVSSKKYRQIWKEEIKLNPTLFVSKIISRHSTRKEATQKEYKLQKQLKVVKSLLYVNMSYAIPGGYFGMDISGSNNPNFGKKPENFNKSAYRKPKSEEYKKSMLGNQRATGKPKSEEHKKKLSESNMGKKKPPLPDTTKQIMSQQRKGRKWYNNGIRNFYIFPKDALDHYKQGRL